MNKLPLEFYLRSDTLAIARELLGQVLVVPNADGGRVSGRIVETEAYCGATDKAAHSYGNRRTARTEIMFGAGGHAYIFLIYGMYFQFNVIVGAVDSPHCVLIRAVEPLEGIEQMRTRRGAMNDKNLTSGPGKLCLALGIDKTFNGADLRGDKIWIEEGKEISRQNVASGKRIGIDYAGEYTEKLWRFWLKDNIFVSRK